MKKLLLLCLCLVLLAGCTPGEPTIAPATSVPDVQPTQSPPEIAVGDLPMLMLMPLNQTLLLPQDDGSEPIAFSITEGDDLPELVIDGVGETMDWQQPLEKGPWLVFCDDGSTLLISQYVHEWPAEFRDLDETQEPEHPEGFITSNVYIRSLIRPPIGEGGYYLASFVYENYYNAQIISITARGMQLQMEQELMWPMTLVVDLEFEQLTTGQGSMWNGPIEIIRAPELITLAALDAEDEDGDFDRIPAGTILRPTAMELVDGGMGVVVHMQWDQQIYRLHLETIIVNGELVAGIGDVPWDEAIRERTP